MANHTVTVRTYEPEQSIVVYRGTHALCATVVAASLTAFGLPPGTVVEVESDESVPEPAKSPTPTPPPARPVRGRQA